MTCFGVTVTYCSFFSRFSEKEVFAQFYFHDFLFLLLFITSNNIIFAPLEFRDYFEIAKNAKIKRVRKKTFYSTTETVPDSNSVETLSSFTLRLNMIQFSEKKVVAQ